MRFRMAVDLIQTICTSLQTDNTPTPHHSIFTGRMLFRCPTDSAKALKAEH